MSLYHQIDGPAKTSVAKLWTGSKDHAQLNDSFGASLEQHSVFLHVPLLAVFLTLFVGWRTASQLATFFHRQDVSDEWKRHLDLFQSAYFFRPPPSKA